ncbi:MAG: hypothetical protein K2X35_09155 [Bryobacteraceae bacterium]|nr:hypothetical protein [Bryobacteraceae bacterium]
MRILFSLASAFSLIALAVVCYLQFGEPRFSGPANVRGMRSPVVALEFARDPGEVIQILGGLPSENRETMVVKTHLDFVFIAAYTLVFLTVSAILVTRGGWRLWAGAAAAVLAAATGMLDVVENLRILEIVDTPPQMLTGALTEGLNTAAIWKWTCAFLAIGLQSALFLLATERRVRVVGILFLLCAVTGMVGLRVNSLFELSQLPMLAGLAGIGWVLRGREKL